MPPWRPTVRGLPRLLNQTSAVKDAYLRYRAGPQGANPRSDWMHATLFRPMPADVRVGRRLACTVHDMIPELLGLPTDSGPHQGKLELAKRSDLILVISESTASCLKEMAPSLADRIVVVPLGVQYEHFGAPAKPPGGVNFPYVLFIGARTGYKRFDLAVEAVHHTRAKGHDIGMLIAGAPLKADERLLLQALPADRVHSMTPTDQELPGIYQHAVALALASEMEGFGLPMLEAFAAGCPVVASDIPVFREVGADIPRYFAKGDAEDFALQMEQLIGANIAPMRDAGFIRAAQMSWAATAESTASAYRRFM